MIDRKATSKHLTSKKSSEEEHRSLVSREKPPGQPLVPNSESEKPQRESFKSLSPELVRERPFKLNLHKKSSENQKLKGKESDLENASDEGSSAIKSLKFTEEKSPLNKPQEAPPLIPPAKITVRSWYEQTLEEEEEEELSSQEKDKKSAVPGEQTMASVEDPNAERILEEEDWMANEVNYDEDDLMDDDDLLIEDMEQEEATIGSALAVAKQLPSDGLPDLVKSNNLPEKVSPLSAPHHRVEARTGQNPSSSSRPSPAKKKRGSPSPIATGVSLRQRNLLVGRASSKSKASKSGQKTSQSLSPAQVHAPCDIEKAEAFLNNNKKSAKVGNNKPPKIPR